MPIAFAKPPSLPQSGALLGTPLAVCAGVALSIFAAIQMESGTLPSIACAMRRLTGIPCPACGGTRCLAACGRLDFAAAFAWNPLVAIGAIALLTWSALIFFDLRTAQKIGALLTGRRFAVIVVANWLYLCFMLPR